GAAGGVMAKELSTAGVSAVVLEQRPYLHERDFKHDEVGTINRNALTNDPQRQPNPFPKLESEKAEPRPGLQYGRMGGGGTAPFRANLWRFHEIDFMEPSHWGAISGTGFEDWPITYADMEPYYTKAEDDLGVSGLAGASPFDPPRSKPYPLPPL